IIRHRQENNEKHYDFLQLLMDAESSEQMEDKREETEKNESHYVNEGEEELAASKKALGVNFAQKKLTEDEIIAQAFLFFIGGYETTASTLSFCSYALAIHPEYQN